MSDQKEDITYLAFYLPQYHPIPENDTWWGKGFTEWTNVGKAKPLYPGHQQPKLPTDLGYYDLRVSEVREQQVQLAKTYGVDGFVYYHYWFGNGFQVLERIANEVLETGKPDFPFCFCWANETWSGRWHGLDDKILAQQHYPGDADIQQHFEYLLPFFKDRRYIKVDGKPVFMVYQSEQLETQGDGYLEKLRRLVKHAGFPDIYLIASNLGPDHKMYETQGYDAKLSFEVNRVKYKYSKQFLHKQQKGLSRLSKKWRSQKVVNRVDARKLFDEVAYKEADVPTFPMVLPNWDNTPRSGYRGEVFEHTSPSLFKRELLKARKFLKDKAYPQKFVIIKSWNEWAEGNFVEPDATHGHAYLEAIKTSKMESE